MFGKEEIKKLETKIDELKENIRMLSERQNSQYTDIMMELNEDDGNHFTLEENYNIARESVLKAGKASISYIQRVTQTGYYNALQILDMLEERGVIEPSKEDNSPRLVIVNEEE